VLQASLCRLLLAGVLHRTSFYLNILPYIYWKFHSLYVLVVNLPFMSCIHPVTDYVYAALFLFCHLQLLRLQFMSEVCTVCFRALNTQTIFSNFLPLFLLQPSSSAVLPVQDFC